MGKSSASGKPPTIIPVLFLKLCELESVAARSYDQEYRYAQRHSYNIENDRVERLLGTLFELLDSIATDYTAIFECLSPERPTDHRGSGRCAQGSTEARQPPRD